MALQETHLLMLNENLDAASAAHSIGYNNAARFNRKYKSVFGYHPCVIYKGCGKPPVFTLVDEPREPIQ